jgi:murein DD-endopeptidase MepM/ murein hydrolase activator NlpD/biotin carboxyl carrier protein
MLRVKRTLASAKRKPARAAVVAAVLIGLVGAPIAVAQVVFVVPAPPAPPAPPSLPEAPEAPTVAAAEIDSDGSVRATFAGRITTITGGKQNGFNVRLEGESEGAPCVADLNGLVSIDVAKGDAVKEGSLIGKRERGRNLRVSVSCTGGEQHSLAIPPAPPAAPAAVDLAELAAPPPAPAPLAVPAPKAAPSPASLPLPPAPPSAPAPMGQQSPLSPAPPVPMAPPATALSPVAPVAPVAPPTPQGVGYSMTNAPYAVISDGAQTTSKFGVRVDPFSSKTVFHAGVDLAAPRGVTVHAPGKAMVLRAEKIDGAGNVVELRTPENYVVRLAQLDEIKVKVGEQVGAGAIVGTVGSSGQSTGPHLHMEVLVNGQPVDPAQVQGLKMTGG